MEAPAVSEARVRMGLTLAEDMVLPNRCHFMVLDVQWVEVDGRAVAEDGYVDLGRLERRPSVAWMATTTRRTWGGCPTRKWARRWTC